VKFFYEIDPSIDYKDANKKFEAGRAIFNTYFGSYVLHGRRGKGNFCNKFMDSPEAFRRNVKKIMANDYSFKLNSNEMENLVFFIENYCD